MGKKSKKLQRRLNESEAYVDALEVALDTTRANRDELAGQLETTLEVFDVLVEGLHRRWSETHIAADNLLKSSSFVHRDLGCVQILRELLDEHPVPELDNLDSLVAFYEKLVEVETGFVEPNVFTTADVTTIADRGQFVEPIFIHADGEVSQLKLCESDREQDCGV